MEKWSFDDDYLLDLVLNGKKRATCSIYNPESKTTIGEESIITSNGKNICKIKVTNIKRFKFKDAKQEDVVKEGEGDLDEWRRIHLNFFLMYYPDFDENYLIEFVEFEVIEIYE